MIHDSTFFLVLVIIVFAVFLIAFTIQEMDRVQKVYVFERDGKIYATSYQNTSKIIEYVKEKYNDIIVLDEFEIEV